MTRALCILAYFLSVMRCKYVFLFALRPDLQERVCVCACVFSPKLFGLGCLCVFVQRKRILYVEVFKTKIKDKSTASTVTFTLNFKVQVFVVLFFFNVNQDSNFDIFCNWHVQYLNTAPYKSLQSNLASSSPLPLV